MSTAPAAASPVAGYAIALGDDALVAAQRLGEWIAAAPQIEEDVALGNIALDLLGQARSLLSYAGSLLEPPRSEDDLAYWRDAGELRNVQLVERPWTLDPAADPEDRDFGVAVVRLLLLATYQHELYRRLQDGADPTLAAVAAKAVKEVDYHRDHATLWVLRLGDGTEESHRRVQHALDAEWPYLEELFAPLPDDLSDLVGARVAVDPAELREPVTASLTAVLAEATLIVPHDPGHAVGAGRRGEHTPALHRLLEDLQVVARAHPGATW
ncbi:1,2-phenylacetyl-CoA epoxidase subunit PaaC [Nocardioides mesophilus]|uniref:Phenylacetate-CoA oxygenase subunit PaaC n=1 Tax=Nocardioides mesophilus TaxID=433659 RepID=A0A7G9R9F3_9ACTN|nr:1,2-phenylacetyl-CoA epoxidase subunit PaaC [Nocardioides mesophilus]QNN52228.1 phenylacetate-CoA oxygenase subunit PaaC [Nocardioides mesophilus]